MREQPDLRRNRSHQAVVTEDGRLVVFGGFNGTFLADVLTRCVASDPEERPRFDGLVVELTQPELELQLRAAMQPLKCNPTFEAAEQRQARAAARLAVCAARPCREPRRARPARRCFVGLGVVNSSHPETVLSRL